MNFFFALVALTMTAGSFGGAVAVMQAPVDIGQVAGPRSRSFSISSKSWRPTMIRNALFALVALFAATGTLTGTATILDAQVQTQTA